MRDMKNTAVTSKQTENIQQQHSDISAAPYHAGPTVTLTFALKYIYIYVFVLCFMNLPK